MAPVQIERGMGLTVCPIRSAVLPSHAGLHPHVRVRTRRFCPAHHAGKACRPRSSNQEGPTMAVEAGRPIAREPRIGAARRTDETKPAFKTTEFIAYVAG